MLRRLMVLAVTAALFGACATYPDRNQQLLQSLPQRYNQFDLMMAWETKVVGGETVIDGVVKNVRYPAMYDLEIWVAVLNAAGKVTTRSVSFVIPRRLLLDETAQFSLKLPVEVAPGTRLRFTYDYRGSEGGEGFGGGLERGPNWMQSFETVVPSPARQPVQAPQ